MREQMGNGVRWAGLLALVAVLTLVTLALWRWGAPLLKFFGDQERVQTWLVGWGGWAPLVSILLNMAQVLLAPVPGQILGLANGYLFGTLLGTLYSLIGVMLGSALAMGLARRLGRPLVVRLLGSRQLARWDRVADRQGPAFFFLVYLLPFIPDDVACFLVGLSPLSISHILVLAALGRLPGLFIASWVGANASQLPWWSWVGLGVGASGLALGFWRYREQVEGRMVGFIRWLAGRGRRPDERE